MPKNIIICSDGTGNTAVKGRGTNVFKLYEAVDVAGHLSDSSNYEQVAIYDDGVGTQKLKLIRVLAGAFGFGLARNVRQLYAELVRCYSKGDHIYVFGFSRGAFTARTLAGFIDHAGILNPTGLSSQDLNSVVGDLYRAYRKARPAVLERVTTPLTRGFRWLWRQLRPLPGYGFHGERTIKFVGVWDTVDAVGFPIPGIAWIWNHLVHRFKFTGRARPDCVQKACHALAIDEARASFEIFLWQDDPRVEQVWFAGVHSNVGGGYPKQGMSLVALDWMMSHAENESEGSLRFGEGLRAQYHDAINVHDNLYDSRSGPAIYYRYGPRDVAAICSDGRGAGEGSSLSHRSDPQALKGLRTGQSAGFVRDCRHSGADGVACADRAGASQAHGGPGRVMAGTERILGSGGAVGILAQDRSGGLLRRPDRHHHLGRDVRDRRRPPCAGARRRLRRAQCARGGVASRARGERGRADSRQLRSGVAGTADVRESEDRAVLPAGVPALLLPRFSRARAHGNHQLESVAPSGDRQPFEIRTLARGTRHADA